jgi:hypothetical protein
MASEFRIIGLRKKGFPKSSDSEKSFRTTIEYIGDQDTLEAERPSVNQVWGSYDGVVTSSDINPIEGSSIAEMTVIVEFNYDQSEGGAGSLREISFEVEWVAFSRSYLEHPEFRIGGGGTYALTAGDVVGLEMWRNEPDKTLKEEFEYTSEGATYSLDTNAKMLAQGELLGQEYWEDFAPVIRKTSTYVGGGPGASTAGLKETPPTFDGSPSGYEWRKSADRGIKAGGQTRWDRVEEWIGATTVLSDKENIYWAAPS